MKISKKTRERAAQLCSLAACNSSTCILDAFFAVHGTTGPASEAEHLATQAWYVAHEFGVESFAEAEAMLRCGWVP